MIPAKDSRVLMKLRLLQICMAVLLLLPAFQARAQTVVENEYTTATLHMEYDTIAPGQEFWALLHLDIVDHWHTYWKNPGDSGIPTAIIWELPDEFETSDIVWLPPRRMMIEPLMNFGYDGDAWHLVRITAPEDMPQGAVPVAANARWLVCDDICVPEDATFEFEIRAGDEPVESAAAGLIRTQVQAVEDIPVVTDAHFALMDDDKPAFSFPASALRDADVDSAFFFPVEPDFIQNAAAQEARVSGDRLVLTTVKGLADLPDQTDGFLEIHDGDGAYHLRIEGATPGNITLAAATDADASQSTASRDTFSMWWPVDPTSFIGLLLLAFLGGIILNAMPCVFPVLSLKVLSLAKKKEGALGQGIVYTLGVLASFAVVAGLLLALKSAGGAAGWGFQMQSPLFVGILAYVLFLIGLNLSGLLEITYMFSGGEKFISRHNMLATFMTGVLATVVATPCTAPFMATAIGVALTKPPAVAFSIFMALGFGLAFPYLLLTAFPPLMRWLPKPGAWMETFRNFLAFPMYLSVVWLLWVLSFQVTPNAVGLVLAGMVFTAFAIWLWRKSGGAALKALSLVVLACAIAGPLSVAAEEEGARRAGIAVHHDEEVFSPERLAELREAGEPVFVYATAAWCITCKVNERVALSSSDVHAALKNNGVTVLKADWTNEDDVISEWLSSFGRSGVPLYVFYPADGGEPAVLPQLLTPSIVIDAIGGSGGGQKNET